MPKINRNDTVTIQNVANGQTQEKNKGRNISSNWPMGGR
jgi:hypothetical protein